MTEPDESSTQPRDAGVSGLYRSAADDAPSAAMDAAILKAARDAVAPKLVPVLPWWKRLVVPAGVAATALFAVMLTLTMERNPPQVAEIAAPPSVSEVAAPVAAQRAEKGSSEPAVAAKALVQPATVSAEKKTAPAAAMPAEPAAPLRDAKFKPAQPAPPALEGRATTPAAPAAKAESAAGVDSAERGASARARSALGAPAPMLDSDGKRMLPQEIAWLEEIRELRRQGKPEEAARRLAEFRMAYPDYPLPADLK